MNELPDLLSRRLALPLPGAAGRRDFAPQLSYGRHECPPMWDSRRAAVLVLLFNDEGEWRLPLTLRPTSLATHSGQVSLPGGEIEKGETPEAAAIRELDEELGVVPRDLRVLGRLSPLFVYASNFTVMPCVAATAARPRFEPNPAEVANLLEPRLVELLDSRRHGARDLTRRGVEFRVPEIVFDGHSIWGATRIILAELCQAVREATA